MKNVNYIIVSLLILLVIISMLLLFRTKAAFSKISYDIGSIYREIENNKKNIDLRTNKILTLVEQNQLNTEEIISRLDLQLNTIITELSRDADIRNRNLGITLEDIRESRLSEADRLKELIDFYIEETREEETLVEITEINEHLGNIYREIGSNKNNTEIRNNALQRQIQNSQQNTEEIISKLDLQLNAIITELYKYTDNTNRNLSDLSAAINRAVEMDYKTQQLLDEGALKYKEDDFTGAVKVYKKILAMDSSNTEALCYFNASLYYQNPGDGSNFSGIKNDLNTLLEENVLSKDEEQTTLNVLIGIGMEEGDSASQIEYQDALQQLEEGQK